MHDTTFNCTDRYTYDAWNRLVGVAHAYRDGSSIHSGQVAVTMSYDGRGRRIGKAVTNTGAWDCTYHYYYDGDSLIETRNGSDQVLKQHVWGTRYIDELCQVTRVVPQLLGGGYDYTHHWACQDSNYNVLGVVDEDGVLAERYEYTPYGQRTVLFSPGTNDVGLFAPTQASRRWKEPFQIPAADEPYGICDIGHQGLMHDEEIGLVYNRARQLHPGVGRFMQRDPLGYVEGTGLYLGMLSAPVNLLDPAGLATMSIQAPAVKLAYSHPSLAGPQVLWSSSGTVQFDYEVDCATGAISLSNVTIFRVSVPSLPINKAFDIPRPTKLNIDQIYVSRIELSLTGITVVGEVEVRRVWINLGCPPEHFNAIFDARARLTATGAGNVRIFRMRWTAQGSQQAVVGGAVPTDPQFTTDPLEVSGTGSWSGWKRVHECDCVPCAGGEEKLFRATGTYEMGGPPPPPAQGGGQTQ